MARQVELAKESGNGSRPGMAVEMVRASGFVVAHQGHRISTLEWPDAELAWRALSSIGPAVPSLLHGDIEA
jgi:hypothetical protein